MANEVRKLEVTSDIVTDLFNRDNSYAEAIVYENDDRTSGKIFIWKNTTGSDNNGTIYKAGNGITQNGEWWLQYEDYLDIKWFGAHPSTSAVVNTNAVLAAYNYAKEYALKLYIPKGTYTINHILLDLVITIPQVPPSPPTHKTDDLVIFGDGMGKSTLYAPGSGITLQGVFGKSILLHDFEIVGSSPTIGTGLELYGLNNITARNLSIGGFETGLKLDNVNISVFEALNINYNSYGIQGFKGTIPPNSDFDTPPNLINFISCNIASHLICAVKLSGLHSVNFQSCDFEANGVYNTPALTEVAAIDCSFDGVNGANGLNVKDCYFEGNIGLADIRVQVQTGGYNNPYYGTHTFQGNTFNRNINERDPQGNPPDTRPNYTNHNILITGSGQDPKRLLGQSKCKLVFIGNGFFVRVPGSSNNYEPKDYRKAIEIQYFDDGDGEQYWEFDVLEEGNTYNGDVSYPGITGKDAPIFSPVTVPDHLSNPRLSPQVSEFTRVKAFGRYLDTDQHVPPGGFVYGLVADSYNIKYIKRFAPDPDGVGFIRFEVGFANELKCLPVIVATCLHEREGHYHFCCIESKSTTGFTLLVIDITTQQPSNAKFDFQVF